VAKNLYVGNMAFSTTEETLRSAFSQYGTVTKVQVIMDRDTGRPRGFAFVEMSDGGDQAIAAMNGANLDGRTLTVNEAKPREDRPRGGGGGGYGGGGGGGGGRGGYGGGGGGRDRY
jgi:cold-inducible RNA-binding protein